MRFVFSACMLLCLSIASFTAVAAQVAEQPMNAEQQLMDKLYGGPGRSCFVEIKGEIDRQTPAQLRAIFSSPDYVSECIKNPKKQSSSLNVWLDSPGGDVDAAIAAGLFLREIKARTFVLKGSCASACVLAFVGGVERHLLLDGRLGLHRPYAASLSSGEADSRAAHQQANRRVQDYLEKVNIPARLLEEMNATSPGQIRWLYKEQHVDELRSLHLVGMDPVYEDQIASQRAKDLGVSKSEYYRRQQRSNSICNALAMARPKSNEEAMEAAGEDYKCHMEVMKGKR